MMTPPVLFYAEDEKFDIFFLRYALDELALPVTLQTVSTGPQAIAYLAGTGIFEDRAQYPLPAVVLLDVNLPGCSGFDVLQWVREQAQFSQLPIIMFSSSARPEDLQKARDLGASDYVQKPASGVDFTQVVQEIYRSWMNRSDDTVQATTSRLSVQQ